VSKPPFSIDEDRTDELPALAATAAMRRMLPGTEDQGVDDTGEHTLVLGVTALEEGPAAAQPLASEVERWAARCAAAEQALADKTLLVADLDGAMAVARRSLESQKRDTEALAAALAERSESLGVALAETARLRDELARVAKPAAVATATPARPAQAAESERVLEEYAALAAYVDQRQQWWERAQREIVTLATRSAVLEHELATRDRLLAEAEARAEREARRASELRAQAIAYAHQVREQQRHATPGVPESLDREERLATMAAEIERLRAELDRADRALADEVAAKNMLERALSEQKRELAARDARLDSLQRELAARRENLETLDEMDRSLQGLKAKIASRLPAPADDRAGPALICLTGDAPQRVVLGPTTTFGRGGQCDVQILTHYVSREHARIVVTRDGATIEDLGSRNGVYVNAIKVARQRLQPGDSIKIGETQFRFVESVAH
jgi:hypothetical protein